jgi:hypothetical protein
MAITTGVPQLYLLTGIAEQHDDGRRDLAEAGAPQSALWSPLRNQRGEKKCSWNRTRMYVCICMYIYIYIYSYLYIYTYMYMCGRMD